MNNSKKFYFRAFLTFNKKLNNNKKGDIGPYSYN